MGQKQIFLDTAIKIGNRLCKQAIWNDNKCTWEIFAPDKTKPGQRIGKKEIAGAAVYQGTAGISLFLSELYRITKDKTTKRTLSGSLEDATVEVNKLPNNSFGFHSGRVGVAYAAVMAGKYLERDDYLNKGLEIITPLLGKENEDYGIDVIGGAGGAIPALLKIYELTNNETALTISLNLAESLIQKANKEPHGWSWGGGNSNYRNLCGYAHGASGIGHAFLELYNLTGSDYYLYAAEQAFIYERQFFNEELNNWPDFRYSELSEFTSYGKIDELKEALKNKILPPYTVHYMSAWCHGAPGIGLARLRAFELTNNDLYKTEALNACENTIGTCGNHIGNYSFCHGIFGNCETLLIGSELLNEKKYFEITINKALEGIERFEDKNIPWLCGTMGSVSDPSLLLGEAGIGYFMLRLFDNNIPSVLCMTSGKEKEVIDKTKNDFSLRKNYIETFFGKTLSLIDLSESKEDYFLKSINFSSDHLSDIEKTYSTIDTYISSNDSQFNDQLKDCFMIEKERFMLTKTIEDFSKEYLHELKIGIATLPDWEKSEFVLSDDCKIISAKYNWENYKADNPSIENIIEDETYYLLFRTGNKIKTISINSFLYVILSAADKAANFCTVIKKINQQFEVDSSQVKSLNEKIKEQLNNAYKNGLIRII